MARIYTRTGDEGTTSLVGGKRVAKDHARLRAYGTIDELQSHLGLLVTAMPEGDDRQHVVDIQRYLFDIGGRLATEESTAHLAANANTNAIETLESLIDAIQATLPPLRHFIVPGGTEASARAHVCRTVCRRAERLICTLSRETEIDGDILPYFNRLSDYLFVLARRLSEATHEDVVR